MIQERTSLGIVSPTGNESPFWTTIFHGVADFKSYLNEYGLYALNDKFADKKKELMGSCMNFDVVIFVKLGTGTGTYPTFVL